MRSLAQEIVVDRAERRSESIGVDVGETPRAIRPRRDRAAVRRRGISASKKSSLRAASVGEQLSVAGQRPDSEGVRREHPDDPALASQMRARERRKDRRTAPRGSPRRRRPALSNPPFCPSAGAAAQPSGLNGAFQISLAYSAIVRSDENQPTLAVLRMLERIQRFAVAPGLVDFHLRLPSRSRSRRTA